MFDKILFTKAGSIESAVKAGCIDKAGRPQKIKKNFKKLQIC